MPYYAHIKKVNGFIMRQEIEEHLENVARLAGIFSGSFEAQDWGYVAGLWHQIRIQYHLLNRFYSFTWCFFS